jgi:hypothetical protein
MFLGEVLKTKRYLAKVRRLNNFGYLLWEQSADLFYKMISKKRIKQWLTMCKIAWEVRIRAVLSRSLQNGFGLIRLKPAFSSYSCTHRWGNFAKRGKIRNRNLMMKLKPHE